MIITGAAPTSPSVLGFIRAALGCQVCTHSPQTPGICTCSLGLVEALLEPEPEPEETNFKCLFFFLQVYEAYGQTECTAGCTYTTPGDWTSGQCCHVIGCSPQPSTITGSIKILKPIVRRQQFIIVGAPIKTYNGRIQRVLCSSAPCCPLS